MRGRPKATFCLIFTIALFARFSAMFTLGAHHNGVQTAHHEHQSIAKSLATGNGFRFNFFGELDRPVLTSQQAPLVPSLLALCYLCFGIETDVAFGAMLTIQILISAATCALLGSVAHRVTGESNASVCTGILAACYPPLIISPLHIQALVWNLFWLSLILNAVVTIRHSEGARGWLRFVVACLGGLHTDPILASVIGVLGLLLVWDAWRNRSSVAQTRRLLLSAILVAVGLTPWTVRNYQVHGRFVLIKDSLPYVFWQGNNRHSQGTDKLLVSDSNALSVSGSWNIDAVNQAALHARSQAVSVDSTLPVSFVHHLMSLPTERARMEAFGKLAWQELTDHPRNYLRLCLQRLQFLLWFDETNPRSFVWHYRAAYLGLVLLAFPAIYVCGWQSNDNRKTRGAALPLVLTALALVLVHTLIITSARFRIPLEMLMVIPAGVTLSLLASQVRTLYFKVRPVVST